MTGSFYGNVTLCGTDIEALRAVAPRPTLAYAEGEDVVVFARDQPRQGDRNGQSSATVPHPDRLPYRAAPSGAYGRPGGVSESK